MSDLLKRIEALEEHARLSLRSQADEQANEDFMGLLAADAWGSPHNVPEERLRAYAENTVWRPGGYLFLLRVEARRLLGLF